MRPVVQNGIAVFHPQGFLDGNNAPEIIPMADLNHTLSLDVDAVLVSLKKVVFFNKNGLSMLEEVMDQIRKKNECLVGFVDYSEKNFKTIMSVYPNGISFCLFETFEVATLFAGSTKVKRGSKALVWHKEKGQRNAIVFALYGRGFQAGAADTLEEYYELQGNTEKIKELEEKGYRKIIDPKKKEEDAEEVPAESNDGPKLKKKLEGPYAFTLSMTHLGQTGEKVASHIQGNVVIYAMTNYIDAEISDRFDLTYHQKSLTVGFKLFVFDCDSVLSMNIHGVHFFAKISVAAAEYGATICIAGLSPKALQEGFRAELEDSGILFFESIEKLLNDKQTLKEYGGGGMVNKRSKVQLTKKLISYLPTFISASIYTMDTLTNTKPEKKSAEISLLKVDEKPENLIGSTIGFFGDVDGIIVLVFSKSISQKACTVLLGEEEHTDETLQDAVSELVNIIGGRVKTLLTGKNTQIKITLPRTFETINDMLMNFEGKKGVQIVLSFGDEPFYLFLTR